MNIETLVHVEIEDRLNAMSELDPTSDEYKATSDAVLKLIDRANKMEELNIQIKEQDLKETQLKEDRKNRVWDRGLKAAAIVVPPVVAVIGAIGLTNYERTDTPTSTATREFWKRVFRLS